MSKRKAKKVRSKPFTVDAKSESEANELEQKILASIGLSICRWAGVEGALNDLFWVAIQSKNSAVASSAFNVVVSLNTKIAMLTAALEQSYSAFPDVVEKWSLIAKELDGCKSKRNKIAHGTLSKKTVLGSANWEVRFLPFFYLGHHVSDVGFEKWQLQNLEEAAEEFRVLAIKISELVHRMKWGDLRLDTLRGAERKK